MTYTRCQWAKRKTRRNSPGWWTPGSWRWCDKARQPSPPERWACASPSQRGSEDAAAGMRSPRSGSHPAGTDRTARRQQTWPTPVKGRRATERIRCRLLLGATGCWQVIAMNSSTSSLVGRREGVSRRRGRGGDCSYCPSCSPQYVASSAATMQWWQGHEANSCWLIMEIPNYCTAIAWRKHTNSTLSAFC